MLPKPYEVIILVDSGIGNAIEALYAVEYCLNQGVRVGFFMGDINKSFQEYIRNCYGVEVVVPSLNGLKVKNLIHSFTYQKKFELQYENYLYVSADFHSTQILSETMQYLSIVRALYPSSYQNHTLTYLNEDFSARVKNSLPATKYVLYTGGSSINSARRWPHYNKLIELISKDNILVVGGKDDIVYEKSYFYPKWVCVIFSQKILNIKYFWSMLKKWKLLVPYAHLHLELEENNIFIDKLSWGELVALLRRCKGFVGNDGGITHLAGACGAKGLALFGPTSIPKNKTINSHIKPLAKNYSCQPCQFGVGGINMVKHYINCPYQMKCMTSITVDEVNELMTHK